MLICKVGNTKMDENYKTIKDIFNHFDPYNLLGSGAPDDEYDSEVISMIRNLNKITDVDVTKVKNLVNTLLIKRFGRLPSDKDKLILMVNQISELFTDSKFD